MRPGVVDVGVIIQGIAQNLPTNLELRLYVTVPWHVIVMDWSVFGTPKAR